VSFPSRGDSRGAAGSARFVASTMDSRVERLAAELLSLPTTDRAELAHRLIESLDEDGNAEADDAGHAEALRRLDEINRGVVQPISGDELFRRVRQRLAK
jgi:putative addiction module component (TIGR02574 family)